MRYQISGRQIDIGEALQHHVREALDAVLAKYSVRPTDATVTFSRSGYEFVCDTEVHLSTGLDAQARAKASEIYAAFDQCAEKMDKQLRRHKRRLKDHYLHRKAPVEVGSGLAYVLAASETEDETKEPQDLQALIIAEAEAQIPRLAVTEAVMQMELLDRSVLVFRNEKQDRVNVVYRRKDGNIGWIDPGND